MDRRNSKPKKQSRPTPRLNLGQEQQAPKAKRRFPTYVLPKTKAMFTCSVCGDEIPPGKKGRFCLTCRWKAKEIEPEEE